MRDLSSLFLFASSDEPSDSTGGERPALSPTPPLPPKVPPGAISGGSGDTSIIPKVTAETVFHSGDTSVAPRPTKPPSQKAPEPEKPKDASFLTSDVDDNTPQKPPSSSTAKRLFLLRDKQGDGKRNTGAFSMNDVSSWLERDKADKEASVSDPAYREDEESDAGGGRLSLLSHPDRLLGQQIGNFRILSCIGRGGFATVYKAEQLYLQQPFAIKVLHIDPQEQPDILERFRREAQALAQLRHNNVVQISDFGLLPDLGFYLVMEYLEGQDLRKCFQKEAPFSIARISRMIEQLCSVLDYIHRKGVIHRDLKPANIFVIEDQVFGEQAKLIDFGVASLMREVGLLTQQGAYLGTARYVSPEQAEGSKDVDGRSDLYALGIILHWMLCGKHPFDGENPVGILYQQIHKAPPKLAEQAPQKPWAPQLEEALQRFLAKDRNDRPEHAVAFWQECKIALEAQQKLEENAHQSDAISHLETQAVPVSRKGPPPMPAPSMRTVRSLSPLPDPLKSQPPPPAGFPVERFSMEPSLESTISSPSHRTGSRPDLLAFGGQQDASLDSTLSTNQQSDAHLFALNERDRTTRRIPASLEETLSSEATLSTKDVHEDDIDDGDSTFLEPISVFTATSSVRVSRKADAADAPQEDAGKTQVGPYPQKAADEHLSVDPGVLDTLGFGDATLVQGPKGRASEKPIKLQQFDLLRTPYILSAVAVVLILVGLWWNAGKTGNKRPSHPSISRGLGGLPPVPRAGSKGLLSCPADTLPLFSDPKDKQKKCIEKEAWRIFPSISEPYAFAERVCLQKKRTLCSYLSWKDACFRSKNARGSLCQKLHETQNKKTSTVLKVLCAFSELSLPKGAEILSSAKGRWVGYDKERCLGRSFSAKRKDLFFRCCTKAP
ncbi:MAG: serine/threonine protein kinase [Myxococcales bacterium]|nr:serine/threonine protein kinase [Myxococcales bacterium]